jgi:DNA mismatch endonuclease Vsr
MDHVSKEVRSKIMATVRSTGGRTTELALGRLLWAAGLRGYRKQWPVAGKPDFAWPALKIAVFVDGCFWHGCTRCKYLPRTHTKFWMDGYPGEGVRRVPRRHSSPDLTGARLAPGCIELAASKQESSNDFRRYGPIRGGAANLPARKA